MPVFTSLHSHAQRPTDSLLSLAVYIHAHPRTLQQDGQYVSHNRQSINACLRCRDMEVWCGWWVGNGLCENEWTRLCDLDLDFDLIHPDTTEQCVLHLSTLKLPCKT